VWRICKSRYTESSFSGEGGLFAPGRWHSKGHRIVYTSESTSLAALEVWVHVEPQNPLPTYVVVSADIPDHLKVEAIEEGMLPKNWRQLGLYPSLQILGTDWLESKVSAVARVPSAVVPGEYNYLLNPLHPDFEQVRPGTPAPFQFDPRMWKNIGRMCCKRGHSVC